MVEGDFACAGIKLPDCIGMASINCIKSHLTILTRGKRSSRISIAVCTVERTA